jgi:hypothetical protein
MRLKYLLGALCAALTLSAWAAIPSTEIATVVEYYHEEFDHYFVTADPKEISDLDTGVHTGWTRTGYRFAVIKPGSTHAGASPVCRFWNKQDSHFYSAKELECEDVKVKFPDTWQFEATEVFRAFVVDPQTGVCPADTTATYRMYNKKHNHRYTTQLSVYVHMLAKGYQPEGDGNPALPIAFCTPSGGDVVPALPPMAPNCTVTASSGTPPPGTTLQLSATCTNNPTTYMWTGCASTQPNCNATKSTVGSAAYTLYAASPEAPGAAVTINIAWGGVGGGGGGGGGGPVPICTIAGSALKPAIGSALTLTANCSQSPTSHQWMSCAYYSEPTNPLCNPISACGTSTSCTLSSSTPGLARYGVAGTNASGKGPIAQLEVEWTGGGSGPPPPPPGGGGPGGVPVCTPISSSATPNVGTPITLWAQCTNSPTAYNWTGITCAFGQCSGVSSAVAGPVTYTVSASNSIGTGPVGTVVVNWQSVGPPVPSCSLSASNPSPLLGTNVTITATCTESPTSYTWTGCSSTTSSCIDSAANAGPKVYSVIATNANGNSPSVQVSVNWQSPPTAPPVCTVSPSTTSPVVNSNLTLTASCNGSPTSYVWTNCTSTTSTCVTTSATTGPQTYTVAGVNSFGPGTPAPTTVTWQQGGGPGYCNQYSSSISTVLPWGHVPRITTGSLGGFGADTAFYLVLTVPTSPSSYASAGNTSLAEWQGPPAMRHMTISLSPCDFRAKDPTGASGPIEETAGLTPIINWNVGTGTGGSVNLQPGQTYYFNWKNLGCAGVCDASTSTNWPH